jgi:glycosyltransferase involved in cell wall biosynthesis
MSATGVSMIVCTRDRADMLTAALDGLRSTLRSTDECIVVDSASSDPRVRTIIEANGMRYVRCELAGLSRARNAGVAVATKAVVAFTDDDCVVRAGWSDAYEKRFDSDGKLGFVTGHVAADKKGRLTVSVKEDLWARGFTREDPLESMGTGANMAFRVDALNEVGGFDDLLGAGGRFHAAEEQDMFWRLLRAGWAGAYEPAASVLHRQWRTDVQNIRLHVHYGVGRGALVSKIRRIDRAEGRAMRRKDLWTNGLASAWRNLRSGYQSGAAADLAQTAGNVYGSARARSLPIENGRFIS